MDCTQTCAWTAHRHAHKHAHGHAFGLHLISGYGIGLHIDTHMQWTWPSIWTALGRWPWHTTAHSHTLGLHLVGGHGIGLHMGVLAVGCADVPMQEGALAADGGAHQFHLAHQAGCEYACPMHKALQAIQLTHYTRFLGSQYACPVHTALQATQPIH